MAVRTNKFANRKKLEYNNGVRDGGCRPSFILWRKVCMRAILSVLGILSAAVLVRAQAIVSDFSFSGHDGKSYSLSEFTSAGRYVLFSFCYGH